MNVTSVRPINARMCRKYAFENQTSQHEFRGHTSFPARGEDKDLLTGKKPLRTVGSVSYGLPNANNLIDLCLKYRGNAEVVHRRADYDHIGVHKFVNQCIGKGSCLPLGRVQLARINASGFHLFIGNLPKVGEGAVAYFARRLFRRRFFLSEERDEAIYPTEGLTLGNDSIVILPTAITTYKWSHKKWSSLSTAGIGSRKINS